MFDFFNKDTKPADSTTNNNNNSSNQDGTLSNSPPTTDANGHIPSGTPVNPLDAYMEMYKNANKDSATPPNFSLDSKVVTEVAKTMDFTQSIDPAILEKIKSGDVNAVLAVIQNSSRAAYQAAIEHSTALTDTHLKQRSTYESQKINEGVRSQLTTDALGDAPNYSHPVVKAELNRVADMLARAHPDASPKQIAEAAQKHLMDVSKALSPQQSQEQKIAAEGFDYTKYLS